MKKTVIFSTALFVCISSIVWADTFGTGANQFTIDFVTISGSTNPNSGYGIVNNDYRMGIYEITNDQWTKFKAAYGTVTGTPTYAYDYDPYWTGTNVPTNRVSWYEAAQFVNWLNTSSGKSAAYKFTGTIHTSDYTFAVWDAEDADGTNLYRNKNAYYFLPTEDEWVKAAYWNGTDLQEYATKQGDPLHQGDGTGGTGWNYYDGGYATNPYGPWNVGSGSQELNGTYDMMGNVWELMESPYISGDYLPGSNRGLPGGSYNYGVTLDGVNYLASSTRNAGYSDYEYVNVGFRVASIPEPASLLLLGLGGLLIRKR